MTLEEYAKEVGDALREAHNTKNMRKLESSFAEADQTLESNGISLSERAHFWAEVRKAAYAGQWLMEKQANNSLAALMKAIQDGLLAREK